MRRDVTIESTAASRNKYAVKKWWIICKFPYLRDSRAGTVKICESYSRIITRGLLVIVAAATATIYRRRRTRDSADCFPSDIRIRWWGGASVFLWISRLSSYRFCSSVKISKTNIIILRSLKFFMLYNYLHNVRNSRNTETKITRTAVKAARHRAVTIKLCTKGYIFHYTRITALCKKSEIIYYIRQKSERAFWM